MTEERQVNHPDIPAHLLWEYDIDHFDFERSGYIVIERIVERGTLKDWKEMIRFYGREKVLDVVQSSKQLSLKDKNFSELFVYSDFLNAA